MSSCPEENVLGSIGEGFRVAMKTLDLFRPSVGAFAVGMAQAALDAAIDYAKERHAFGKSLGEFQAVSHELAEMATRTQAARLLVYEAALTYDRGEPVTKASAMAKLFATETAQFVIDGAIQIHGAKSLEKGHLLEHLYRDVRGTRIYEGHLSDPARGHSAPLTARLVLQLVTDADRSWVRDRSWGTRPRSVEHVPLVGNRVVDGSTAKLVDDRLAVRPNDL